MSNTQQLLEVAINHYGISDIRTLELSQKIDEEIVKEQKKLYEMYKEHNNVSTICN